MTGRPAKSPRLYLRRRKHGSSLWVIRDGNTMISTGLPDTQLWRAEAVLQSYVAGKLNKPTPQHPGLIYFITCEVSDFPVKIGWTTRLDQRASALQNALPYRLVVLATVAGDAREERSLHETFRESRLNGEWFRRTPELMARIQIHRKDI